MPPDTTHARAALPAQPAALAAAQPSAQRIGLITLALLFLRIGCTSVGGFMAMVSVTQQVLCERRRLLPPSDLLDGLALASVLPGPVAINVATYAGYRLRGVPGAIIALLGAVLPAFVCMVVLGTLYLRYGHTDALRPVFRGIAPAIIAIVLAAGCRLWQNAVRGRLQIALGAGAALLLAALPGLATTLTVMAIAAAIGYRYLRPAAAPAAAAAPWSPPEAGVAAPDAASAQAPSNAMASAASSAPTPAGAAHAAANQTPAPPRAASPAARSPAARLAPFLLAAALLACLAALALPPVLLQLSSVFAGMSLLAFGGGYVFIPLLQHTVVDAYHWLTPHEFLDALAITQLSPGPAMISSALVGLKVAGLPGATAASLGMFLPSAVLIIGASGALQRVRNCAPVQAALSGMRAALTGMVFAAAFTIARASELEPMSLLLCAAALVALMRFRLDAMLVVACAALTGGLLF